MKFIAVVCGIIVFSYWAVGRAVDIEGARADGGLTERVTTVLGSELAPSASPRSVSPSQPPPVTLEPPGYRYQGLTARAWAKRAVQQRKNSTARGRTIKRLKAQQRRGFIPWYWLAIGSCESGLSWTYNGSSGFDGAVQFHPGTWSAYRLSEYPAYAYLASPFQQLVVAEMVLARQGWGAWPACSRKLGLR